jgi:predicted nucleic acid-binding protein
MKLRRNPGQRAGILQAFKLQGGLTFAMAEVDHAGVLTLAEETGLTGYDASYLWLARQLNAELVTLDRALAWAAARFVPGG